MKTRLKPLIARLTMATAMLGTTLAANAAFTINLNFTGGLSAAEQSYFTTAKTFWEGVITGYQSGISLTGFTIDASGVAIDGAGGILGSAGPDSAVSQGGYLLTTSGSMQFDSADIVNMIGNGSFTDVIKHEMAHVIGFGTLWTNNNVYVDSSGQFTGAAALATYKSEFNQPGASFVPVELGGSSGTADGHWNEVDGGAGLTGITDGGGNDMQFELMTGWLNSPTFLSLTTAMSFVDIGYEVAISAVPEPGTWALLIAGLPLLGAAAQRRRKAA